MSMERINPDFIESGAVTGDESLLLHLERYHYAGKHLAAGFVADVACGVGYGSYLLATQYGEQIKGIFAVDMDADSIAYAQHRYAHLKIDFVASEALGFKASELLHTVVSLETIEHLPDPVGFVRHMALQLASGGRFVASAPVTPSMDANPYHLHDFTVKGFKQLFFDAGFKEVTGFMQVQRYHPLRLMGRKEKRSKDLRRSILRFYLQHPGKLLLRLWSLCKDGFANKYLVVVFEKL